MEDANRFFFTKEELDNSPSRKSGIEAARELSYRQQAANFIQDMGQRLQLSQLCINTAIVYMHRFYVFHSFAEVHRNHVSVCVLFLAAKVEEQPRKLEHLIKVAHACLHKDAPPLDVRSEAYLEKLQEVVAHENILLQALGFVLAIEHPHTYVVKVCQLVKASKDLAQTSYIMATTSLHMTTMCLQYKPTVVACVCIHLACKWSSYMIEPCSEGRDWFYYVDRTVTWDLLEELTQDFIAILETSPHRFKRKLGCKDSVIYHNPKCIMDSSEKPSTSEKRNGLSRKDSSPGPSTSLSFDFCPDFDEKRVQKFDSPEKSSSSFHPPTSTQIPSSHHSPGASKEKDHVERKLPQIVENNISKKAPEVHIKQEVHVKHEPHFKPEVHKQEPHFKPEVTVKQETHVKPTEVHIKPEVHSKHDNAKRHVKRESPEKAPVSKSTVLQIPTVVLTPLPPSQPIVVVLPKESKAVDKTHSTIVENNISSKKSLDGHSKHERREKHKSKHSCHSSSKEKHSSKHSEQVTGLKVKILREKISLKGNHESQKTTAPIKAESPQKKIRITIKQPPLPETPKLVKPMEAPLKLVLTKDKSGSGSYVTSHKNERESRKRSHSTVVSPDVNYKNSYETHPLKYPKNEHTQKSHGSDVHGMSSRPNKIPRHSSHRTTVDNSQYQHTPPLPHPKHRGHNMPVGKTNSNTVQPPLPPPQPPPPPPPPE